LRLLVVEDDPDLNRQLATALTDAGYVVDRAFDGEEGHYLGETEPYDAVILDIGLPKMDGISVIESWRRAGRAMPVLMLTARGPLERQGAGASTPAPTIMWPSPSTSKKCSPASRSAAPLGRPRQERVHLRPGAARLAHRARVSVDGNPVKLTSHEYRLLSYLDASHRPRGLAHRLVEHLYDQDFDRDSNTIEVSSAASARSSAST
jgi:two-component system OmpR family response regulator